MNKELKPCPFCGCKHIAFARFLNYSRKMIELHCPKCNAHSGAYENEGDLIQRWNNRPFENMKEVL